MKTTEILVCANAVTKISLTGNVRWGGTGTLAGVYAGKSALDTYLAAPANS